MSDVIRCYVAKDPARKGKQIVEGIEEPIARHSLQGRLEWGRLSNGAKDLALNILAQWFGRDDADRYHLEFAANCVARLPESGIEVMRENVADWLEYARSNAESTTDDEPDARAVALVKAEVD